MNFLNSLTSLAWMSAYFYIFRGGFPRRFLYPVHHQAQGWTSVLPPIRVQPARHPAARRGGGPCPSLPVRGPAWQASP